MMHFRLKHDTVSFLYGKFVPTTTFIQTSDIHTDLHINTVIFDAAKYHGLTLFKTLDFRREFLDNKMDNEVKKITEEAKMAQLDALLNFN
jgi:hypothetical protein